MKKRNTAFETVMDYHQRTKHRFDGYARGPKSIDWEAQPDLFRRFDGAPRVQLPLKKNNTSPAFRSIFEERGFPLQAWNKDTISLLLQFSLGLAAWKQYASTRWSLRCNPSSGNLHPTECYLLLIDIEDFENGLYHYRADNHQLELRCRYGKLPDVKGPMVLLGFSSIHWREAWKYGERAYRYCQLDLGHALAAVSFTAALLGYQATPVQEIGTKPLQQLLGLNRSRHFFVDEQERGDLLLAIHSSEVPDSTFFSAMLQATVQSEWYGRANRLDRQHHYEWPVIDEVAAATNRPSQMAKDPAPIDWPPPPPASAHPNSSLSAYELFQCRRSAQAFDSKGAMSKMDFFRLMDRLLLRGDLPPWSSQLWPTRVHVVVFVHSVEGLEPGLYLLARRPDSADKLKTLLRKDLLWEPVQQAPSYLPLFCLARANARRAAMQLGCHQDIAGDSVFSLSMLAEFESVLNQAPWRYNELFWEAGMIGQVLYLEAEAMGLRGTGIGCFFDDAVHEMLGIRNQALQALYHFTVGAPLEDPRITTLPPYPDTAD